MSTQQHDHCHNQQQQQQFTEQQEQLRHGIQAAGEVMPFASRFNRAMCGRFVEMLKVQLADNIDNALLPIAAVAVTSDDMVAHKLDNEIIHHAWRCGNIGVCDNAGIDIPADVFCTVI